METILEIYIYYNGLCVKERIGGSWTTFGLIDYDSDASVHRSSISFNNKTII